MEGVGSSLFYVWRRRDPITGLPNTEFVNDDRFPGGQRERVLAASQGPN